jgi:hypothetical protein
MHYEVFRFYEAKKVQGIDIEQNYDAQLTIGCKITLLLN